MISREALGRFSATDPAAAVANLVVSWTEFVAARVPDVVEAEPTAAQIQPFVSSRTQDIRAHLAREPLTISDIRRARRATGLPLSAIAARSHIPVGMLRQLEWGYFANWPSGQYGRTQLVRYARSAGLDEHLVVSTLLPLIDQADRTALVAARSANRRCPCDRRGLRDPGRRACGPSAVLRGRAGGRASAARHCHGTHGPARTPPCGDGAGGARDPGAARHRSAACLVGPQRIDPRLHSRFDGRE